MMRLPWFAIAAIGSNISFFAFRANENKGRSLPEVRDDVFVNYLPEVRGNDFVSPCSAAAAVAGKHTLGVASKWL